MNSKMPRGERINNFTSLLNFRRQRVIGGLLAREFLIVDASGTAIPWSVSNQCFDYVHGLLDVYDSFSGFH